MFVALVMVPLVIDHAYVAPAVTGTLATSPVVFGHVAVRDEIVGVGLGLIGTLTVLLAEQEKPLVTTSVRSAVPEAPDVYVMVWMFVAEVIVPFTMDHAYVVAPAGPSAVLPGELAQTCA